MDEELDSGLLNIALSDSEDASSSEADGKTAKSATATTTVSKADRNAQSEAEFQQVKSEYRPKVENGEIYKTVRFPLDPTVSKAQVQELLHAVEELYFFRRYDDAVSFVRLIFSEEGKPEYLDEGTKNQLRYYELKCLAKAKTTSEG